MKNNIIEINGWVGRWDPQNRFKLSAMTMHTDVSNVVLGFNHRGDELASLPDKGPNGCDLMTRSSGTNGPKYFVSVTGTNGRVEMDLTVTEYNSILQQMQQ